MHLWAAQGGPLFNHFLPHLVNCHRLGNKAQHCYLDRLQTLLVHSMTMYYAVYKPFTKACMILLMVTPHTLGPAHSVQGAWHAYGTGSIAVFASPFQFSLTLGLRT